jgi:hypothetical protein
MFLYCPKGCCRQSRRHGADALAFETVGAWGESSAATARRVATPPEMQKAYSAMASKLRDFGRPPTLEFYDDLHGVGGLFIPGDWVIAIGRKDMADIVERVLSTRWAEVARVAQEVAAAKGFAITDVRKVMLGAAMGRCIAHELGHAAIHRGWHNPFAPDGEAGADYYAGRLDAARGNDWRLGEMFFRAIGCVGPSCSHPSPQGRSNAYVTGYREQTQRAA